uniref:(California timema) hypothetical protein n=1 Tax=Timema californicum TaxID=61474 RepID=A0A7R9JES1_TIMCA|nr:unnamed protein product [Timema californicum]
MLVERSRTTMHRCINHAEILTKLNHHHAAKGTSRTGFLPRIDSATKTPILPRSLRYVDPSRPVTLELSHGADKQVISLPTEQLDKNKRYYVTFTIKGGEERRGQGGEDIGHRQAKSL